MTQDKTSTGETAAEPVPRPPGALSARAKLVVIAAILVLFSVIIAIRSTGGIGSDADAILLGQDVAAADDPSAGDPVLAYEEALESGRPIYVLFFSRTCAPCVEIGRVAVEVLPDYADSITFVAVSTDDPRSRPLFSLFQFQYIPTSFFLAPDGTAADQHTGVLSDPQMRERLDSLLSSFGAEAATEDSEG